MLKEVKIIDYYPSASGIEYFNNQYYVIGDDAKDLLILDSNLNPIDSISLYTFSEKRIPKNVKADLEAITLTKDNKLLILSSGAAQLRNGAWLIDPVTKQKDSIRLDTFYQRLRTAGIKELNIEGACRIPGSLVLSNRGNKNYPKNHLIITSSSFFTHQDTAPLQLISAGSNTDSSRFEGISGLCYSSKSDRLLITVSTENIRNNIDDGDIGKSYLWIIENISSKKKWKAINPNHVIDLNQVDHRFTGQKIESVCINSETKKFLELVLVADNDNGSSTLFKLIVEKR